jgi:hypothetical protein
MNHDEESAIEGLEELPVQVILNRIACVLKMGESRQIAGKHKRSRCFQVLTTSQSIQIDCYGTEGKTMDL